MVSWFSASMPRAFSGKRIAFWTNDARTTHQPHKQKWTWSPTSYCLTQINSIQIKGLNVKAKIIKFLKENIGENLCDLGWIRQGVLRYENHKNKRKKINWTSSKLKLCQRTLSNKKIIYRMEENIGNYIYICMHIHTHTHTHIYMYIYVYIKEGNSNPFLCSCLVNSMTLEPSRLQFIGVTKSQTQLSMHAHVYMPSQVALMVRNPASNAGVVEMQVRSLGWDDPLEKGGHGNPLQYSCLENSMDIGAWQATVHGVAKSWTWMTWLNMHIQAHNRHICAYILYIYIHTCTYKVGKGFD